ncbi:MAG: heavy-metal-associated domain-containing protein [Flavobacteriales bacterium]|jgi:Cu+-exporting ATPase|nr:heavy-metal-associated domain-containing protein [Flavobacteriales bacterium]
MKALKTMVVIISFLFAFTSCKNETTPETKTVETTEPAPEKILNPDANYVTASFSVEGMKCAMGCAKVIEKNLFAMDGVKEAKVDFDSQMATVTYDEKLVNEEKLIASVAAASDTYKVIWDKKEKAVIEN